MRRLIALAFFLAAFPAWALVSIVDDAPQHAGGGGGVAPVFVNHVYAEDTGGGSNQFMLAPSVDVTAGNALLVFCHAGATGITITVSDTATAPNTFTAINSGASSAAVGQLQGFYAKNITGKVGDVPFCDFGVGVAFRSIEVFQYSGASISAPLDGNVATACASATSCTSGTFSTTGADVVVCAFTDDNVANTYVAGNIGGVASTLRSTNTSLSGGEDKGFTTAQTNITGAASAGTQNWLISCGALKQ